MLVLIPVGFEPSTPKSTPTFFSFFSLCGITAKIGERQVNQKRSGDETQFLACLKSQKIIKAFFFFAPCPRGKNHWGEGVNYRANSTAMSWSRQYQALIYTLFSHLFKVELGQYLPDSSLQSCELLLLQLWFGVFFLVFFIDHFHF